MTTATAAALAAPTAPTRLHGLALTPRRVVHAEVLKLTSLRSTWLNLGALVVAVVGIGLLASVMAKPGGSAADATSSTLAGSSFALLLVAAVGALVGAREFGSGMIRTSLAAVPQRTRLLVAKAVALTVVLLPVAVLANVAAVVAGTAVLDGKGVTTLALTDPSVLRVVLANGVYLTSIALIGLAVGVLVRNVAGAVAAVVGLVLVVPSVLGLLLPHSWTRVLDVLPTSAGDSFIAIGSTHGPLTPTAGAADLLAWVVVALALAAVALRRRDA